MRAVLCSLFPLLAAVVISSTIFTCVMLSERGGKPITKDSISSYGEWPGAKYFIFSVGFIIGSILLAASAFARHRIILLTASSLSSLSCMAKVGKMAVYQCLVMGMAQILPTIIMAFTNGIRQEVHIAFAVIAWGLTVGYVCESALLLMLFKRRILLMPMISIFFAMLSISLLSCWIATSEDLFEWIGILFILLVFLIHSIEIYMGAREYEEYKQAQNKIY